MENRKPIPEQKASFAVHLAQGKTQILAFQLSHPDSEATLDSQYEMASKLAKDPQVQARVSELAKNKTIADIDTQGEHLLRTLAGRQEAQEDGNRTAKPNTIGSLLRCTE